MIVVTSVDSLWQQLQKKIVCSAAPAAVLLGCSLEVSAIISESRRLFLFHPEEQVGCKHFSLLLGLGSLLCGPPSMDFLKAEIARKRKQVEDSKVRRGATHGEGRMTWFDSFSTHVAQVLGEKKYFRRGDLSAKMGEDYARRHAAPEEEAAPVGSALAPKKELDELIRIKKDLKGKSE